MHMCVFISTTQTFILDAINRKSFHSPILHYDVEMTLSDDIVTDLTSFL